MRYSIFVGLEMFIGTFIACIPLWIMIYFDKKDDGVWTGFLGHQIIKRIKSK